MSLPDARPFLVTSRKGATGGAHPIHSARLRTARHESVDPGQFGEVRAYRPIAASLAQGKQ
ncbi:MAG: hypothetical protein WBE13_13590 [Candidatus Acidiferrum sp.]